MDLTLFSSRDDTTDGGTGNGPEKDLLWVMQGLTQRNQDFLKSRPDTPRLYKSGVRWEAPKQFGGEVPEVHLLREALGRAAAKRDVAEVLDKIQQILGGEHFCDIGRILELGAIDCDGLACWRAAELRQAGIAASPMMTKRKRPDGGTTYHALVMWPPFGNVPYETTEDPSLLLGMHQPERKAERDQEIQKNKERCEIIQQYGIGPGGRGATADNVLNDILGIKRATPASIVSEVERLLKVRA